MTERRCNGCRTWYDSFHPVCPECDTEPSRQNPQAYTNLLNRHLFATAERANPSRAQQHEQAYKRIRKTMESW